MIEVDLRTVEASAAVLDAWKPGGAWDLTEEARAAAQAARTRGVPNLMVVLSARNCRGCEILDGQLRDHAAAFADRALVLKALGGDFSRGMNYTSLALAGATFSTPGVPFSTLWRVEKDRLRYLALGLGPFEGDVAAAIDAFVGGASKWVREAAGVPIGLEGGGCRATLTSGDGFAADLEIPL